MRKSSVYLPERLKAALSARAAETGSSEAELIRGSLELLLADPADPSWPRPQEPVPGRLVGVGVGPGDPDLVTVRALSALRRADRVLAPSTAIDAVGRAEAIVRVAMPGVHIERIPFTMAPDRHERDRSVEAAAEVVSRHLRAGSEVAWITLGDPLVYSTFPAISAAVLRLRPSTVVEQVPGIMAFQALASRTGTVVADERTSVTIRTTLEGEDFGDELRRPDATVVLYKGGRRIPELASLAEERGRGVGAVAGELLGMTGERVGSLAEMAAGGPASYLATVIIPAATEHE